jgi:4-oxalocrotonate tautomerase
MPHVIIKMVSGRTEQQKSRMADEITKTIMTTTECDKDAVSISIEDIEKNEWVEKVYMPDIFPKLDILHKKPGYDPL